MIKRCQSGVVLASGGSRDSEFDIVGLRAAAHRVEPIHSDVAVFYLDNQKVVLLRDGTALNFRGQSVPSEVIDLVFGEILMCMMQLVREELTPSNGLLELEYPMLATIADQWLSWKRPNRKEEFAWK